MAEQAYAYVTLIPVAKGFQREVAKQLDGVGGVGGKAGQVTGKNFSDGFGGQLKKLGILAAGALATAGVGRLLGDSVKQASDLGESLNAVNVAFGEAADGVIKLGESSAKAMGVSQTEFNAAAVRFSAFAERVVGEGGNVAGFIGDISTRAADFASVFNIEVSEALQVFQSGLAGEAEPLKRFGINLLQSEVAAFAMANGIAESASAMTEAQKVQARYGLLMEQTRKTQGDFVNTSDSLANQQRILQAEFANVQASVGIALVPVLEKLQKIVIEKVLPAFEDFGDWLKSPAGTAAIESFTNVVVGLIEFIIDLTGAIGTALPILAALGAGFLAANANLVLTTVGLKAGTIAMHAFNLAVKANPIGLLITALALAAVGIGGLINKLKEATPSQQELSDKIADTTKKLEFYRAEQDKSTNSSKLYESTINDLEAELREYRGALQDSYNWTEAQKDASYRARDAAIAQRHATKDLKGEVDRYTDSVRMSSGALISNAVLQEAQYNFLQDYNYSLGRTTKTLQDWIDELTERNYAEMQGISTSQFYSTATDDIATSTSSATTATRSYTTAIDEQAETLDRAIPANQEFLDVINGVANVDPGEAIRNATSDIQSMIVELDKANELTRLEGGFVEFMTGGGAKVTAKFDPVTGELLESTTDPGPTPMNVGGRGQGAGTQQIDVNALNKLMNSDVFNAGAIQELVGTSYQGIIDSIGNQVSLVNPETGERTTFSGGSDVLMERAIADGFTEPVDKFTGSVDELIGVLESAGQKAGLDITPFAKGGVVTGPTRALIGEAGPEMVIPLNRFESMLEAGSGKTLVYNAAPNQSVDSEAALFQAMRRAKVVASW